MDIPGLDGAASGAVKILSYISARYCHVSQYNLSKLCINDPMNSYTVAVG